MANDISTPDDVDEIVTREAHGLLSIVRDLLAVNCPRSTIERVVETIYRTFDTSTGRQVPDADVAALAKEVVDGVITGDANDFGT